MCNPAPQLPSPDDRADNYARALAVAEQLKRDLSKRLVGTTVPRRTCGCAAGSAGPSRVVAVTMPAICPQEIAMCASWTCDMEDGDRCTWSLGLCDFVSWVELFPLFRNAFAGIDIQVNRPYAESFYDNPSLPGDGKARQGAFISSGRTVVASEQNPAFVKPIGDSSQSVWLNAELRVDSNLERQPIKGPAIACNVDPLAFAARRGRGAGRYFLCDPRQQPTFYIVVPIGHHGVLHLPIARLTALSGTGEATFTLGQSVEVFQAKEN